MGQILVPDNIADLTITGNTTVELPASIVTIGGQQYRNSANLVCDLSTTGVAGLDTGAIAASTRYYIYAIVQGGNIMALIASLSDSGPSGYTSYTLLNSVVTDTSSLLLVVNVPTKEGVVNPNLIINGGFDYWQRGTTGSTSTASAYVSADRWYIRGGGGAAGASLDRSTDLPTNAASLYSGHFYESGDAIGNSINIAQKIEADNISKLVGKEVTISFKIKPDSIFLGANPVIRITSPTSVTKDTWSTDLTGDITELTIDISNLSAGVWQDADYTFTVPAACSNGLGVWISDTLGATGANYGFYITDVKLEKGTEATEFTRAGVTLTGEQQLCWRYTYVLTQDAGLTVSTTADNDLWTDFQYLVEMRIPPNLDDVEVGVYTDINRAAATLPGAGVFQFVNTTTKGARILASGNGYGALIVNGSIFNAEL